MDSMAQAKVNGKYYRIWGALVDNKREWVGGTLEDRDHDVGDSGSTELVDIVLRPNGDSSALIEFVGKDFSCASDVQYCGISLGDISSDHIVIACTFGNDFVLTRPKKSRT